MLGDSEMAAGHKGLIFCMIIPGFVDRDNSAKIRGRENAVECKHINYAESPTRESPIHAMRLPRDCCM